MLEISGYRMPQQSILRQGKVLAKGILKNKTLRNMDAGNQDTFSRSLICTVILVIFSNIYLVKRNLGQFVSFNPRNI